MKEYLRPKYSSMLLTSLFLCISYATFGAEPTTALYNEGIYLIPYPQEVVLGGENFLLGGEVSVVLDRNATDNDRFAARELVAQLKKEWGVNAVLTDAPSGQSIILTHKGVPKKVKGLPGKKAQQGYQLTIEGNQLIIRAKGEAGLFYGTQTLLQIIKKGNEGAFVPGMEITDWPDIPERASHYDTKHHQDKREYVESFIRDLARYKINMLVWEWEDKFAYPSHPEIGAPGAFTMEEMQELTRYAKQYHVQLVPLVQGLGHVSFILKWPQYNDLREVPASNWEFCPLKEGSYELLFDLWQDAIEATPGSEYIHIGSDETYELGVCEQCRIKSEEIGKSGLYHLFTGKAGKHLQTKGRKVMCWERPMGWTVSDSPAKGIEPFKDLVLTESYSYETDDFKYAREAKEEGFEIFSYDPNPGVVPLMIPYFFALTESGKKRIGSLEKSYNLLTSSTKSGYYDGMINTSWDDAGLHNQMWMMSFINSAEWTWSGNNPALEEFTDKFFLNYYGEQSSDMRELYQLMNKAGYYYFESFERRVWHYGDIGKTHLPDLPRGDNLEYDEYWNREYAARIEKSSEQIKQMERASEIIRTNMDAGVKNSYDLELFTSIADLVSHTGNTYLALSELERAIKEAHNQRFLSHQAAYKSMENAIGIIDTNLSERQKVYNELVVIWEKTRLPKGLSTDEKKFFHRQDRARHFAFRKADMSYLIYDEELLGLEEYREKLLEYMEWYKLNYLLDIEHFILNQYSNTLKASDDLSKVPRRINDNGELVTTSIYGWTSGFFAGSLWYIYELTGDDRWKDEAVKWTEILDTIQYWSGNHDVGFMINCSYGNGLRLSGNEAYKNVLIRTAESLCERYNSAVESLESWNYREAWDGSTVWYFPVIIDNMMNLELLFEASRLSGDKRYEDIAIRHARTCMKNHYRDDYSSFHVVDYDTITGEVLDKATCQGLVDESSWARGQAWGLYGIITCYRYTRDSQYLKFAEHIADYLINHPNLPEDMVPYWDYNVLDPGLTPEWDYNPSMFDEIPRDASAAAITSSALFELSKYSDTNKDQYFEAATTILSSLASSRYLALEGKNRYFILNHSVGSIPHGVEIDVPLVYADYYFLEALLRYSKPD